MSDVDKAYVVVHKFIQGVRHGARISGVEALSLKSVIALNALELLGEHLRLTKKEDEVQDMRSGAVGVNLPPLP